MSQQYRVPVSRCRTELEVKKSRFICTLDPVTDEQQGRDIRSGLQLEFPAANHHCWASQLGAPGSVLQACSDDGEPHGTAGKPILNQLHHANLIQVQAVVTRIFGGTKLGTGGLVRAYSDAVAMAIAELKTEALIEWQSIRLHFGYELESSVRATLASHSPRHEQWQYTDQVALCCDIPLASVPEVKQQLQDLSAGRLIFKLGK